MTSNSYTETAKHRLKKPSAPLPAHKVDVSYSANKKVSTTLLSDKQDLSRLRLRQKINIWVFASGQLKNPFKAFASTRKIMAKTAMFMDQSLAKVAAVDGKYFSFLGGPAWPSAAYKHYVVKELKGGKERGRTPFSITRNYPLTLGHNTDVNILNPTEALSLGDLKQSLRRLQQAGAVQLYFTGGEPMLRYQDILSLLADAQKSTEFWLQTSGWSLTADKSLALKAAGLTGVTLQLDHFDPEKYNALKGSRHAYGWVLKAAEGVRKAKLVLCLKLSATPDFYGEENLLKYARLAKNLGASCIQLANPEGTEKQNQQHQSMLNAFAMRLNTEALYLDWPIVVLQQNS